MSGAPPSPQPPTQQPTRRPFGVGLLVAVAVLSLVHAPGWWSDAWGPARGAEPFFPSTVARYSWSTSMLSEDRFDAASLLYQNGVGVEFMDTPQSVLLSTDGSTYRRLDEAEAASIPADQGDPAVTVLSPDGTVAVVGSAGRTGEVQVVRLRDGHREHVTVSGHHTALPVSIGEDGRTVLVTTSDDVVHRYADPADPADLGLARLDLETAEVLDYPGITGARAAALSPDGRRVVAHSDQGVQLLDATSGRVTADLNLSHYLRLDGDAWSPDGRLVALTAESALTVVDVSGPRPVERHLPLGGMEQPSAIGWRDPSTVLVHGFTNLSANTSELYWVDAATGAQESFATYRPNFTGASLLGADAARDLVPRWQVQERPVNRDPSPLPLGVLLAVVAGLAAARVVRTPRRPRP